MRRPKSVCEQPGCGEATFNREICPKCGSPVPITEYLVLASISPYVGVDGNGLMIARTYGRYFLPACITDHGFVELEIEDATDYKVHFNPEGGEPDKTPVFISCRTIIADFLRTENLEEQGAFLCAGAHPTQEELQAARNRRREWLVRMVQLGDQQFGKFGPRAIQEIPDVCKRAVVELRESRPDWVFKPSEEKEECPGCGSAISRLRNGKLPATCKGCGAILDREAALALGLIQTSATPETPAAQEELETVPAAERPKGKK